MKLIISRTYNSKTHFYEYFVGEYIVYAKLISSYSRPLYMLKYKEDEVYRLEDDNLLRPWLGLFSLIIPQLRPQFTLKSPNIKEKCIATSNGKYYTIKIGQNNYYIKGHSHCIVSIWENECQVGLIKRSKQNLGDGFETVEVLYDKRIPQQLLILFSAFGWERFVGTIKANRTITTISLTKDIYDINWKPQE